LDNEPIKTNLEIKLAADNYYGSIHIDIFEGNMEDSVIYKTYETSASVANVSVPINKKYTLVATYYIPDDYFLVVNSVTPYAIYDDMQCEKPCYFVKDRVVDLRLKHMK
jgi:hypothetical protein